MEMKIWDKLDNDRFSTNSDSWKLVEYRDGSLSHATFLIV